MLQQDGDGVDGDDGDGVVDDGDDDPDEVQRDDDDDGDDFPSPGGNFPGRISLPESFFSLDGFRPVEAAVFFVDDPPELGFPWGRYTRKGDSRGGPRGPHPSWGWSHLGPRPSGVWGPPGSPRHLLVARSVFRCSKTPRKGLSSIGVSLICWLDRAFSGEF